MKGDVFSETQSTVQIYSLEISGNYALQLKK